MSPRLFINSTWKNDKDDGNEYSEKEGHFENYWNIKATTVLLDKDQADETFGHTWKEGWPILTLARKIDGWVGMDEEEEYFRKKNWRNGWKKEE